MHVAYHLLVCADKLACINVTTTRPWHLSFILILNAENNSMSRISPVGRLCRNIRCANTVHVQCTLCTLCTKCTCLRQDRFHNDISVLDVYSYAACINIKREVIENSKKECRLNCHQQLFSQAQRV